jgi:16S rRNA (cytosine967-C5)-methyltransferase
MTPDARAAAAIKVLDRIGEGRPAEQALANWARRSRFAGSGDRAAVRDIVFDVLRCRRSCAALGGGETGRALVLGWMREQGRDPAEVFKGEGHGPARLSPEEAAAPPSPDALPGDVRCDLPDWLMPALERSLGNDFVQVAGILRTRAPVGLRVNLQLADHAGAEAALLEDGIESVPHPLASTARVVTRNPRRLRNARAYREGLVELQDPASQAVIEALLPVPPGARILDYCAGGGGKALALAAATGRPVAAHDAAPRRMADIPARAARAGADIRCLTPEALGAGGDWDLVLADAPCSGSGAWRRQPEAKWTLTPGRLAALLETQAAILDAAAALVAPGGRLAYATCSLLDAENGDQVAGFLERAGGAWRRDGERRFSPLDGGDGFYVAQLTRA